MGVYADKWVESLVAMSMSTELEGEGPTEQPGTSANPFSFKSFLSKRAGGGEDGATGKKGVRKRNQGGGKKSKKEPVPEDGLPFPELEDTGTTKAKDNPFSFRKFVARKEKQKDQSSSNLLGSENSSSESSESEDLVRLPHPLAGDNAPEPLLIAGSSKPAKKLSSGSGTSARTVYQPSAVRPDTKSKKQTLFVDSETSSSSSDETPNHPLPLPEKDPPSVLPVPVMVDPLRVDLVGAVNVDPLSLAHQDGTALSGEGRRGKSDSESSSSSGGMEATNGALGGADMHLQVLPEIPGVEVGSAHLKEEIEKLTDENKKLRSELKKSQEAAKKERARNHSLKEQLKALRVKEAEDMKALEDMVQRVEENLVATTKRAASSESTVVKLKQEIQSLQTQLAQSNPQSVHQHYEEILLGVREKTGFASQQLMAAAQKADQSIRELLTGADTLKNVAQVLEYVDRISEVKEI